MMCYTLAGYLLLCVCTAFTAVGVNGTSANSTSLTYDGQNRTDSVLLDRSISPVPRTQATTPGMTTASQQYISATTLPVLTPVLFSSGENIASTSRSSKMLSVSSPVYMHHSEEESMMKTLEKTVFKSRSTLASHSGAVTMLPYSSDVQFQSTMILLSQAMSTASLSQGLATGVTSVSSARYTSAQHTPNLTQIRDTIHSATESLSFLTTATTSIQEEYFPSLPTATVATHTGGGSFSNATATIGEESFSNSPTSIAMTYFTSKETLPPDTSMFTSRSDIITPQMTLISGPVTTQGPVRTFSTVTSHTSALSTSISRILSDNTAVFPSPYETTAQPAATTSRAQVITSTPKNTDRNLKIAVGVFGSAVVVLVSAVLLLMVIGMSIQCKELLQHVKTKVRTPDKRSDSFRYTSHT